MEQNSEFTAGLEFEFSEPPLARYIGSLYSDKPYPNSSAPINQQMTIAIIGNHDHVAGKILFIGQTPLPNGPATEIVAHPFYAWTNWVSHRMPNSKSRSFYKFSPTILFDKKSNKDYAGLIVTPSQEDLYLFQKMSNQYTSSIAGKTLIGRCFDEINIAGQNYRSSPTFSLSLKPI